MDHIVEQAGKRLERGWLLPDGATCRKSQVSMQSVDPEGSPAESPEIQGAGQKLELRPSSFDGAETLEPVPLETIARFATMDAYPIETGGRPSPALIAAVSIIANPPARAMRWCWCATTFCPSAVRTITVPKPFVPAIRPLAPISLASQSWFNTINRYHANSMKAFPLLANRLSPGGVVVAVIRAASSQ